MGFKTRFDFIPLSQVKIRDRFWSRWIETLRTKTIQAEYEQLVKTGRLANFKRAAKVEEGDFEGLYFNDSDVYKWLEAAAYALAHGPSKEIEERIDEVIGLIEAAQEEDGYLNTFFQIRHPQAKWRNLYAMHEMYCAGHLYEAAVAHYEATGSRRLIDVAVKNADLVASIFGPGKRRGYCGHEEIELALIKLGCAIGRQDYVELAKWMVEERGKKPSAFEAELTDEVACSLTSWDPKDLERNILDGQYCQDHAPIREHTEIVGHAVRAMYLYIAATAIADGANDEALERALVRVWENMTQKRMYITGGIGPAASNEGFTVDYDLPNRTAYAETCASVGLVLWGTKYLQMTGNSDYADVVEKALFNGTISGISLSGDGFFYCNRLESRGEHQRVPWMACACCPPNIARMIGSVSRYCLGASASDLWIHVPLGCTIDTTIGGVKTQVEIQSDYPWSGEFQVAVSPEKPVEGGVRIRIPAWAADATFEIENSQEKASYEDGYAVFRRVWKPGDAIKANFHMAPVWMQANPKVLDDVGRVCLTYGPLVYCLEQMDFGREPLLFAADIEGETRATYEPDLLHGVVAITATGLAERQDAVDELYVEAGSLPQEEASAKFVPYYSWCNRGPNSMLVWVRSL